MPLEAYYDQEEEYTDDDLLEALLPECVDFLFDPSRYKVMYGGRGSAKSHSAAKAALILGASTDIRFFCGREFQKSIQDSIHKLLSDQIEFLGLQDYYHILQYEIRSKVTKTLFAFEGLRNNVTKIKSMEGFNIALVEEAEKVSKTSWDVLVPTIRTPWFMPLQFLRDPTEDDVLDGGRWVDPEIWVVFNPNEETDETYQRFVVRETPPGAVVRKINWRDNPFFPKALLTEMEFLKRTDYDAYLHIWEGECCKMSAAQILREKYIVESFEVDPKWSGPYFGTDWGFAQDPTASVKCWIDERERKLYIEYEAYGFGVETDDTPALLSQIPNSSLYVNRADCARPETISYCRRHGHPRIVGAEKWAGSVEDGISYLRQEFDQIVIHPRCKHTAEEARLWSYKIDKNTQDVLPVVEDKNNHCWDAVRYALAPLIKGNIKFRGEWWRRFAPSDEIEKLFTIKMVTVAVDDVSEGAAELRAVLQLWGVRGYSGMYHLEEVQVFGTLPEIIDSTAATWNDWRSRGGQLPSELWVDAKSVGQTFIRTLRGQAIPAREWEAEDKTILEPEYRAKQASVHVAGGRVLVPEGPCTIVTEIEGLSTNAMSLALLIWQLRGGGQGPIP